jgi:import inner membrane translocase subunit TIM44
MMYGLRSIALRSSGKLRVGFHPCPQLRQLCLQSNVQQSGITYNLNKGLSECRTTFLRPVITLRNFAHILAAAQTKSFHTASLARSGSIKDPEKDDKGGGTKQETSSSDGEQFKEREEKRSDEESADGQGEHRQEKSKEQPPPPPPHGDKTPWQVFTETLQSEFQASKEWKESTKALSAGAQQFTESESVRKAREAYSATTGAVSSTTGKVIKSTAGVVGKGAAWTWSTPVVKAARTGVNATASAVEKGTRPLRETETFKNIKDVIDDGSSSRYGGWTEKAERKKRRELRELQENGGTSRTKSENMTENAKYGGSDSLLFVKSAS